MTDLVNFGSITFMDGWATRQQEPTTAIPTPFRALNAICGDDGGGRGFAEDWFVTIGGGTGAGKSLLAQNLAVHAMKSGRKVGFLTLEMSHRALAGRFYAMSTGTAIRSLERGRFDTDVALRVWEQIYEATGRWDFFANTEILESIGQVMDTSYHMLELGCALLVVDYMQLVSIGDDESIYRTVTEVAGQLRRFASKEGVVVLALSQYNTPTGRDTSQPPTMYGLMGGGTIANNGDLVLLLDHSRYKREGHLARTWLVCPKNRHGDTGEIPLLWDYRTLQVREAMPDEEHQWPK